MGALSPQLTPENIGAYTYPWGRFGSLPEGIKSSIVGESRISARFVEWCGRESEKFL